MTGIKGDYSIRKKFVQSVQQELQKDEVQHKIDVAETKATPDAMWKVFHDDVIHKVAKEHFTLCQEKADKDPPPFIGFVKKDGEMVIRETRKTRFSKRIDQPNELQNLRAE